MSTIRPDETFHRLLEWTSGKTPSERLAAQILIHEGYGEVDPSHPLGGKDGGKDITASKEGRAYVVGVHFPRGQTRFTALKKKFLDDAEAANRLGSAFVFVTNQELKLSERDNLRAAAPQGLAVEIYHLERVAAILDTPVMRPVRAQFLNIAEQESPTIQLGGSGGAAPGAGGGGGAAVGQNAVGGPGGPGGRIVLDGGDAKYPGAGGGGVGVIGDGWIGGEGGQGGQILSRTIPLGDGSPLSSIDILVGKGGQAGGPGEDTILLLKNSEGKIFDSLMARGGAAGAAPRRLPRNAGANDVEAGLKVIAIVAAEYIRLKGGLFTILDGGWDWWQSETNPFRMALPLLVECETGGAEPGTLLALKIVVRNPKGFQVLQSEETLTVPATAVRRTRFCTTLNFTGSLSGIWSVEVSADEVVLRSYAIEIRLPQSGIDPA